MSKTLALELGPYKIRVNVVEPALMETSMGGELGVAMTKVLGLESYNPDVTFEIISTRTPLQGTFMPLDQVANTVLFILSDMCPQMTGQVVAVDGGYLVT